MEGVWKELLRVSMIAVPMVAMMVLQYLLQFVSMLMVGQLDELSLSGFSIATSFTSVAGFSFLFGMAGALDTLCGQAYGAQQYKKLGVYTYCSITCLTLLCLPISLLWVFSDKILILLGQDPTISNVARKYSIYLIPNLFSYAILQSLVRFYQTQNMILPMFFSSLLTLCLHVPICWTLVFHCKLGVTGAALALGFSYWFNVVLLGMLMFSRRFMHTRAPFSKEVFLSIWVFVRFAVPSAIMVCLEWWSYEVLILLAGLLPNPKLESSVIAICFTISYLHYYIPYGFGATVSTRVSNELGAGNPEAAKMAILAITFLAILEVICVSGSLFSCRYLVGHAFSNQKEVTERVGELVPFLCISMIMDTLQAVLSGVARGSGWQKLGAYVNLGAYYLVGIPIAAVLAFVVHLKGKGLLIGLAAGSCLQAILLAIKTLLANWPKQASQARQRIMLEENIHL